MVVNNTNMKMLLMIEMIPDSILGQAAGIATSMLWVATSMFFTAAGRRIGPTVVNTVRIFIAIVLLGVMNRLMFGAWFPSIPGQQIWYLALSGMIGLSIGDQALFVSFVYIGPRLAILIMSTSPLWAVFFGWVVLGERLEMFAFAGIALTVGGVCWVVMGRGSGGGRERGTIKSAERPRWYFRGVVLAVVASVCQAAGILLSKQGMGHVAEGAGAAAAVTAGVVTVEPLTATFVRMMFAGAGVLPILAVRMLIRSREAGMRRREEEERASDVLIGEGNCEADEPKRGVDGMERQGAPKRSVHWRSGLMFTFAGAFFGPFLGVWMSLVSADLAPLGVAQTLCSLSPILILPVVAVVDRERVSIRAVLGAFVAVAGVGILVFSSWS